MKIPIMIMLHFPFRISSCLTIGALCCFASAGSLVAQEVSEENAVMKGADTGEASLDPVDVEVSIDWSAIESKSTRDLFSINCPSAFDPTIASKPEYHKNIDYIHPGLIRYHCTGVMRDETKETGVGWLDIANQTWNAPKIKAALDAAPTSGDNIMITIPFWPPWMGGKKSPQLDPSLYEAYAKFCADLVRIVNVDQNHGVKYFEVFNEKDGPYWLDPVKEKGHSDTGELVKIYNLCAQEMKKVCPSIQVGGPAACQANMVSGMREFVKGTLDNLDFLSFHSYATGSLGESNASIYDKAQSMERYAAAQVQMLNQYSPNRHIKAFLNEYNICWTWRVPEPRMRNNVGAVYDSLAMVGFVKSGLDGSNAWNDRELGYGKMSPDFQLRPGAHVYHYFNNWLVGKTVRTAANIDRKVVPFAVIDGSAHNFVLINRSGAANKVHLTFKGWNVLPQRVETAQISADGLSTSTINGSLLSEKIALPPNSVTFYSCSGI